MPETTGVHDRETNTEHFEFKLDPAPGTRPAEMAITEPVFESAPEAAL